MLKYIRGELYRLLHKKSMFIFFAVLAGGYLLINYIRSGGFAAESVVDEAINLFNYLPVLAGGFLFFAIYTDDLSSKNLISLVGFGFSKVKIVISKFILMSLFSVIVYGLVPLFHIAVFRMFGCVATADAWMMVYAISVKYLLMTVAFSTLAGIVVYGLQRTTFAIVTYVVLAFGIVSGLLSAAFSAFAPGLKNYLMSGISDKIMAGMIGGTPLTVPIIEFFVYVIIMASISAFAFHKKEMEF